MYSLSLSFECLPESLNVSLRTNCFKYRKIGKQWDMVIWSAARNQIPPAPLSRAKIWIVRHSYRMLDYDGLVGSMKPVVDALVTAKIIEDDSWKVTGAWSVDQRFRSKKDGPLLEIFVDELN